MDTNLILDFLAELKRNNNRTWFEENKPRYQEAKTQFESLIAGLISRLGAFEPSLSGLQARDCVFRIYRDVRFSADKSPYKPNFGAYLVSGGRKSPKAGYYLHLEDENSFLGGGLYCPPADVLNSVRREIFNFPGEFRKILNEVAFKRYYGGLDQQDKLKRLPREFPADFKEAELLKHKSYVCMHAISNQDACDKHLMDALLEGYKLMQPLNRYLNEAIRNKGR